MLCLGGSLEGESPPTRGAAREDSVHLRLNLPVDGRQRLLEDRLCLVALRPGTQELGNDVAGIASPEVRHVIALAARLEDAKGLAAVCNGRGGHPRRERGNRRVQSRAAEPVSPSDDPLGLTRVVAAGQGRYPVSVVPLQIR